MLTYRILGQLSISRDGEVIELPTLMLRKVAAVLLCHPHQYVSAEVLAEAIWEGSPPPTARKTLQIYVHRLRRALGGEHTIVRGPIGYRISLEQAELDAVTFAVLRDQAREAADEPAVLRQALSLWSGPALQGTGECSYVDKFAAQLDDQRLQVIERYAATELNAGRHAEVLGMLTETATAHPYREALQGQLMLALYRSGRQAEALEHYQVVRAQLAEDLGIDPGPELRRVHEQILRNDDDAPLDKPNFLPAIASAFVGREPELAWLTASTGPLVLLSGAGGVGKTALAVQWAHRAASRYPDGVLYVDLHGYDPEQPATPLEALTHLLRCLGVAPEKIPVETGTAAAMFRAALAGKRMLLVLDNARTLSQIRPLLPGEPASLTLITSRDRLSGLISREGAQRLMLTVLTADEAVTLLHEIAGYRVAEEPEAAQRLADLCSRLPLAVRIAGAHLVDQPELSVVEYVSYLETSNRARALTVPDDESFSVHAVIARSYDALAIAAQRVFRLLGPIPAVSFSAEAVAALAQLPPAETLSYLDSLVQAHLLEQPAKGRYTFHDLLREYARSLPEAGRPVALQRYYGWLLENTSQARELLSPGLIGLPMPQYTRPAFASLPAAIAWLDAEHENLLPAVLNADQLGTGQLGWLIADSLRSYLKLRRHMGDWLQIAQAGLAAAVAAQDLQAQSASLQNLAAVHYHLSELKDALRYSEQALAAAEEAGWLDGQTLAYNGIGVVHLMQAELPEARQALRQAATFAESAGRTVFAATMLNNLAFVELDQGKLHEAIRLSERSLEMHRAAGSMVSATYDLIALALAYRDLGQLDKAVAATAEAARMFVELGDVGGIASTKGVHAWILSESDDFATGLSLGEEALVQAGQVGNQRSEGTAHCGLAGIHRRLGNLPEALMHGEQALARLKSVGDHTSQIYVLLELAQAHLALHAFAPALNHAEDAFDLARSRGLANLTGRSLSVRAKIHSARGDAELALGFARQAIDIFDQTGENLYRQMAVSIVDGIAPVTIPAHDPV